MPRPLLPTAQLLAMLAAAPARITTVANSVDPVLLATAPAPGQWSACEVLAHLRACADVWGNCIVEILNRDHPTLRAVNPRTWIEKTDYREQLFPASLQIFTQQRADLLAILQPLSPEGWARSATITGAGKTLEWSVHSYAQWLAEHERPHLKQIEQIVAAVSKE